MEAQEKYEIIKSLIDHHGNKTRAAIKLGCTKRHIDRLIHNYMKHGKSAFIHGNKGRKPVHAISQEKKAEIILLYNNKYWDATFSYACELLEEHDGIKISPSALTKILYDEFILSPRSTRKTKKYMTKILRHMQKNSSSAKEQTAIQSSIIAIEDAHSRRPRCANFGEMLQMDASLHEWFGGVKSQLHIAIDDSTGMIVGAHFEEQETLKGYYHVFYQILTNYGIPAMFYTDRRTVFEYKKKNTNKVEHDTFTQLINQTLAVITERTVDTGHSIKFQNQFYKTMDSQGLQVHYHKGTKGLVIKTYDGQLLFSVNDKLYELNVIPQHERKSKNFDFDVSVEKPKKRNIPSPKHPWRSDSFLKYKNHNLNTTMIAS